VSVSVIIALASDVAQIFVMAPPYGTGVPASHLTDDSRASGLVRLALTS